MQLDLETQLQQMSQEMYRVYRNTEIQNNGCSLKGETRDIMCREN